MKRRKRLNRKFLFLLCVLLSFLLICLSTCFHFSKPKEIKEEETPTYTYENSLPAFRELYQNQDIVAELEIASINLDELIVKTDNNNYYLNHDIQKQKNINGSIFIDYRTEDIDNARQLNIYGHNSSDDETIPFKVFENYQQEEFFQNNQKIILKTDKNAYSYKIFAVSVIPKSDDEHMIIAYEGEEFLNHLNRMRSKTLWDTKETITEEDHILIIQTCLFNPKNFLLVFAKKEEV